MRCLLICTLVLVSGCSTVEIPILEPEFIDPVPVHPPLPSPVKLTAPQFYVLTESTYEVLLAQEPVYMGVTSLGYQDLSQNIQELRRYIIELQNIIIFYKKSLNAFQEAAENSNGERDTGDNPQNDG